MVKKFVVNSKELFEIRIPVVYTLLSLKPVTIAVFSFIANFQ
jgi:hypothetical protein